MSGGRRKEEPPQPQLANGALKVSVWSKVLRSDAAWDDKVRKAWRGCWLGRTRPGLLRSGAALGAGGRGAGAGLAPRMLEGEAAWARGSGECRRSSCRRPAFTPRGPDYLALLKTARVPGAGFTKCV